MLRNLRIALYKLTHFSANNCKKLTEIDYFCMIVSSRETKLTKNH